MLAVVGVPSLVERWWPLRTGIHSSYTDLVILPVVVGLLVGRLVNVAFDAPGSFGRIGDLLIIRSGVDFWPGALVAVALVAWGGRADGVGVVARLADLAPLALIGYAVYEGCCLFRDGCYGPAGSIGLRPPGVATTMFPVGLAVAVVVVAVAVAVRALARRADDPPARDGARAEDSADEDGAGADDRVDVGGIEGPRAMLVVVAAVAGVATVRAVASIWLPHVGEGLTRPHLTSIAVAVLSAPVLAWLAVQTRRDRAQLTFAASEGPTD